MDDTVRQFNRELSWLEFNQRVLEEAQDPTNPLLERLKFLAITASNLDEFFMVRVGALQQLLEQDDTGADASGMSVEDQLQKISWRTHQMVADQEACFRALETALAEHGLRRVSLDELDSAQAQYVEHVFDREFFPLITPRAVPPGRSFPVLPGLGVCLGVRLLSGGPGRKKERMAVVPLPRNAGRFVTLESEKRSAYLLLEDVVRAHVGKFFPDAEVAESIPFRITRNADLEIREDQAGDLLAQVRKALIRRRESACVRLEINAGASPGLRSFLKDALGVPARDVYETEGALALGQFFTLSMAPGFEALRNEPWEPQVSPSIRSGDSLFDVMSRQDVLLYHPYESFEPVLRFLEQAADDPEVLAIKQTLYRTSRNSPFVAALARAAERGKNVTVIVELQARFDEARNIEWAQALERSGAQVIYGIRGLKTHAKVCIVIRREPTGIRRYVHFGTGNYNEITARLYTDVSVMTCSEDLAADASMFFNTITGYSQPAKYRSLEAAPLGLKSRLLEMIESEGLRCRQRQRGHIMAKLNSLVDPQVIEALYTASQAGVKIELLVRGICCLRPGVPGLSETITVTSVVDRLLEHSRIFYFRHGGDAQVFVSSADWMPRNLDRRIELMIPVEDEQCRKRLVAILRTGLKDTVKGRKLMPDGTYIRLAVTGRDRVRSQEVLYREACDRARQAEEVGRHVFQPLRPASSELRV